MPDDPNFIGYPLYGNNLGPQQQVSEAAETFMGNNGNNNLLMRITFTNPPSTIAGVVFFVQYNIFAGAQNLPIYSGSMKLNPPTINSLYFGWDNGLAMNAQFRYAAQWVNNQGQPHSAVGNWQTITPTPNNSDPNVGMPDPPTASFAAELSPGIGLSLNNRIWGQVTDNWPLFDHFLTPGLFGTGAGQGQPGARAVLGQNLVKVTMQLSSAGLPSLVQDAPYVFMQYEITGDFAGQMNPFVAYKGSLQIDSIQDLYLSFLWPNNVQASVQTEYVGLFKTGHGQATFLTSDYGNFTYTPSVSYPSPAQPGQPNGTCSSVFSPRGTSDNSSLLNLAAYPLGGDAIPTQAIWDALGIRPTPTSQIGPIEVTLTLSGLPAPQTSVQFYAQWTITATGLPLAISPVAYQGTLLLNPAGTNQLFFRWMNNVELTIVLTVIAVWNDPVGTPKSLAGTPKTLTFTPNVADIDPVAVNADLPVPTSTLQGTQSFFSGRNWVTVVLE